VAFPRKRRLPRRRGSCPSSGDLVRLRDGLDWAVLYDSSCPRGGRALCGRGPDVLGVVVGEGPGALRILFDDGVEGWSSAYLWEAA
jgi:hypothetical protein